MLGDETQTFHRLPFSLFLASNCFPCCFFCFLLLFVGWENVPQQVPNMHSYSKYVTFRGKVVCRKCYTEWKRSLLYIFLIISYWYRYQSVIIHKIYIYLPPWKSMWFTEEIALSTLNLSLFICTFICKIGSYIKNGTEVHKVRVGFWAAALTNFKHPLVDLTIIKIVIPFYNAISTIVFESRKSHG